MQPIFIFSLPRSGSTLLQRILSSHSDICSSAEPWLLLPFLYARKKTGLISEYSHFTGYRAVDDFVHGLPNKENDFNELFRDFILGFYNKKRLNNEVFFIDKTPRYYLIIPEIYKIFPDAKFIFLFRNPAHVFSSIISTFGKGRLNKLHGYDVDIQSGPALLASGYILLEENAYRLQYEDLINDPEKHIKELFDYIGVSQQPDVLTEFNQVKLSGGLGDSTGVKKYSSISSKSLRTWSDVIDSKVKKIVLLNLLQKTRGDVFEIHGYSKQKVIENVSQIRVKRIGFNDMLDFTFSWMIRMLNFNLFFSDDGKWSRKKYIS